LDRVLRPELALDKGLMPIPEEPEEDFRHYQKRIYLSMMEWMLYTKLKHNNKIELDLYDMRWYLWKKNKDGLRDPVF
jgi:hypothetical protein